MATTENPAVGWHILSEANGTLSRETVTIASGSGALVAGTVLGKITTGGEYAPYDNTLTDGTQTAVAVLFANVDATSADVKAVVHVRQAEVWASRLVYKAGTSDPNKAAALVELATLGIVAR